MTLSLRTLKGQQVLPWLDELAALRITVFRDFPYLYDGSLDYEHQYLRHYAASANSLFVLALADKQVVGAATALPLLEADAAFAQPFATAGIDPSQVFYFGESVLQRAWRGKGLGHAFFDHREAEARQQRLPITAFCAVVRPDQHPQQPDGYRPLDTFWQSRGYQPKDGLVATFHWQDLGEPSESAKTLQFWLR